MMVCASRNMPQLHKRCFGFAKLNWTLYYGRHFEMTNLQIKWPKLTDEYRCTSYVIPSPKRNLEIRHLDDSIISPRKVPLILDIWLPHKKRRNPLWCLSKMLQPMIWRVAVIRQAAQLILDRPSSDTPVHACSALLLARGFNSLQSAPLQWIGLKISVMVLWRGG